MKAKNNNKRIPAPTQKALEVVLTPSNTDVNGSYTGTPKYGKKPVQDVDDL